MDLKPDERLPYKTIDGTVLHFDIFRPENRTSAGRRSGIVFFHGGGWSGGTPEQFYPHCRFLSGKGMVAISAQYRLEGTHGTTPYECVADGKSAIRYIRRHAGELGIDPDRLTAGGGSAGGHVAAAAAMVKDFNEAGEDISVSPVPNALVLFNAVVDNSPEGYGYERVKERWREFSPMENITEGAPPTILFLGSEDTCLRPDRAGKYKEWMNEAGARCDLHIYDGQPHGFFNYNNGENPFYELTLAETEKFLISLGLFSNPDS